MIPVIQNLSEKIEANAARLDRWYRDRLQNLPGAEPPIYASVDLRNSGFKISVVDTNLFPAGFNNLCETFSERASQAFRVFLRDWHPCVSKVLIFPEEHTRNLYYWKNIASLKAMLTGAGLDVEIGSASTAFTDDPFPIALEDGGVVNVRKVQLKDGYLRVGSFVPDLILINNDLSAGTPEYLKNLNQLLLPSPHLGWHRRRKSDHFHHFEALIGDVSQILEIDPWLLAPISEAETGIDLSDEICLKRLKDTADRLFDRIRQKYRQYGIARAPYLFVKNNAGTYGMGLIHVESGEQLLQLNRKLRNKLESAKGGQKVRGYLLQEGIPTADFYRGKPLEPVVYLVGGEAVGTFFRIHEEKNEMESLNAPGMAFSCLCFHKVNKAPLFRVGALLGQTAALASVLELHDARKTSPTLLTAS